MDGKNSEMLLGKSTPVVEEYSPELLYPIPRAAARQSLGIGEQLPFYGADLWHAYELSWLDRGGRPRVAVGRFFIPAHSSHMVESKSFKLYLNSLNGTRFATPEQLRATVVNDIAAVIGCQPELELLPVDAAGLAGRAISGSCLDELAVSPSGREPEAAMLEVTTEDVVEEAVYSHLLRSLCPVTGQPDWATVWIRYRGYRLSRESLLDYLVAFRNHQEFHEQCVERMFMDIRARTAPQALEIQAFYTRRGGLDINPYRALDPAGRPLPRMNRQ